MHVLMIRLCKYFTNFIFCIVSLNKLHALKIQKNPSCIDSVLTNKPRSFQTKCVIETGLSDFHRMTVSVLKMHSRKAPPKVINYRDLKKFGNERFMDSLHYTLSEEQTDYSKNLDKFFEVSQSVLNKHAPEKRSTFVGTVNLS